MSEQQKPLTYDGVLELFQKSERRFNRMMRRSAREFDRRMAETDQQIAETTAQMKRTDKKISDLGSRIGEIIESMVKGKVVAKFRAFDYAVTKSSRNVKFGTKELPRGEIDLFLEDGDVAILIEVKTTLETKDVHKHIERIEKYRLYADATSGDKRRFIGAVAGAVVMGDAEEFAHENGMYVIVQSGNAVEILTPPEGFRVKKW